METVLRYRGRAIGPDDVTFIRALIATRPATSRRALSIELCRAWGWVQDNGALRDAVCRGLLLALHRGGHIELPAPKPTMRGDAWARRRPVSVAVDTTQEFDLGDRVLVAQAWPTAHTNNDLTVYDRKTRTLFASDLLFVQHIPVVDGKLRGWLRTLRQLARIDAALVVPGHGPTRSGGPDAWKPQQEYLEALQRETRAALKSGKTLSQAVDSVATEAASHWQLAERFHRRNVTAAFAELEWED